MPKCLVRFVGGPEHNKHHWTDMQRVVQTLVEVPFETDYMVHLPFEPIRPVKTQLIYTYHLHTYVTGRGAKWQQYICEDVDWDDPSVFREPSTFPKLFLPCHELWRIWNEDRNRTGRHRHS